MNTQSYYSSYLELLRAGEVEAYQHQPDYDTTNEVDVAVFEYIGKCIKGTIAADTHMQIMIDTCECELTLAAQAEQFFKEQVEMATSLAA